MPCTPVFESLGVPTCKMKFIYFVSSYALIYLFIYLFNMPKQHTVKCYCSKQAERQHLTARKDFNLFSTKRFITSTTTTYRIIDGGVFIAGKRVCLICVGQLCIKVLIIMAGFTQLHIETVMLLSHILKTMCTSNFFCHRTIKEL